MVHVVITLTPVSQPSFQCGKRQLFAGPPRPYPLDEQVVGRCATNFAVRDLGALLRGRRKPHDWVSVAGRLQWLVETSPGKSIMAANRPGRDWLKTQNFAPASELLMKLSRLHCASRNGTVKPMKSGQEHSVTGWIGHLKEGDQAAAQPLWERYFSQLVVIARAKLKRLRKTTADEDEEDAALSAFNSFCAGVARGRFPKLEDRDDLWRLLVVITARKALAQANRQGRQKRGGGRVVTEAVLFGEKFDGSGESLAGLEQIAAVGPTPEFAAMMAEECRRLLDELDDDALRQVAISRMEGYNNDEIAGRLGCARRTIARRLELIRKTWLATGEVA
jgi:DNA-directed RNA polymerase specialized sigma24 family protein